jgi:hypothetical protein
MNDPTLGYIGEDPEEVEFEPLTAPSVPEPEPAPVREPQKQPA